ncbi:unnamed protein product [Rhizoctonia solani]|uniref:Thioredoxin domain-containing protein n=1 Tax=Rhizoctonia solani TaxID=456999 RepID=A0A8H2WGB2_9AGAM|nr:unnamed protein product [Rhizoctonia solani]
MPGAKIISVNSIQRLKVRLDEEKNKLVVVRFFDRDTDTINGDRKAYDGLAEAYQNQSGVAFMEIEKSDIKSEDFEIRDVPAFWFYKGGVEIKDSRLEVPRMSSIRAKIDRLK